MNIKTTMPRQLKKPTIPCHLFSQITKKKLNSSKQQQMVCTKDTIKTEEQSSSINLKELEFHIQNKVQQFKLGKAEEVADISIDGQIPIRNIIKRMKSKIQKELFEYLHQVIKEMDMYEQKSAEKTTRSPKELGSTIEHTYTPKSIETPAFDFDSSEHGKVNEFSVGSNEFTLNPKSTEGHNMKVKQEKEQLVSEFTLGARNPASKRIKDKIMNSKKNQIY